jgi:glycolate oxidase iron-sulfur subunit
MTANPGSSPMDKLAWEDYARCVHCGLCLNHCPTYRLWGMEADSPRGRIRQMLLVDQGQLDRDATYVAHIDRCLDCRACETACPSGVDYGRLVEAARADIERNFRRPLLARIARDLVFRRLLPYPHRIAALARLLRFYQRSPLRAVARATGVLHLLGLAWRERLLPEIDGEFFFSRLGQTFPARGVRRARVGLFAGCLAQVTFTRLHDATIRVLTANGCEVVVPASQLCCGALLVHAGVRDTARGLARANMEAFLHEPFDAIVTNAAGCGSTLKEYPHLFPRERNSKLETRNSLPDQAALFGSKVQDVTEFLAELGLRAPMERLDLRVTYQDSCHLVHGQNVREAPRQLILAVPGVELVEMPLADHCCGSAGVYNVTQTEASRALLEEKMRHAQATGAQAMVTANPGCILQLRAGLALYSAAMDLPGQAGKPVLQEVLHVVELLDRALPYHSGL